MQRCSSATNNHAAQQTTALGAAASRICSSWCSIVRMHACIAGSPQCHGRSPTDRAVRPHALPGLIDCGDREGLTSLSGGLTETDAGGEARCGNKRLRALSRSPLTDRGTARHESLIVAGRYGATGQSRVSSATERCGHPRCAALRQTTARVGHHHHRPDGASSRPLSRGDLNRRHSVQSDGISSAEQDSPGAKQPDLPWPAGHRCGAHSRAARRFSR